MASPRRVVIAVALRDRPLHHRVVSEPRNTATLVAGEDRFDHFDLLPPPEEDLGAAAVARHRDSVRRMAQAIMQ